MISCHDSVQSTSPGGPTMERNNRRNTISILHRSCLYTFLWAAPKQATGVTMALKYLRRSRIATFLFTKYGLFQNTQEKKETQYTSLSHASFDTKWISISIVVVHPPHLAIINAWQNPQHMIGHSMLAEGFP